MRLEGRVRTGVWKVVSEQALAETCHRWLAFTEFRSDVRAACSVLE